MKTGRYFVILALVFALPARPVAAEQGTLDPNLEPLRPFLGKTWKSEAAEGGGDKPKVNVARWERALNGKALRVLHSVNDGEYGGETIVRWDEQAKALVYHYFTTAGFTTTGTMSIQDGRIVSSEKVTGNAGGVTEVRGTAEMSGDGSFRMKTEYLKDGEWQPGRDAVSREDATAQVVFR
ncbi:MAG: hypothetical protein H0V56_01130 [Chthoniobacterales bacterium]|nr:hypothetical protein [Chthoniobacterales bacterium]